MGKHYKKRYRKKRAYRKKRSYRKRGSVRSRRRVAARGNPMKYFDSTAAVSFTATATRFDLSSNITRGTTGDDNGTAQRIGKHIRVKGVLVTGSLDRTAGSRAVQGATSFRHCCCVLKHGVALGTPAIPAPDGLWNPNLGIDYLVYKSHVPEVVQLWQDYLNDNIREKFKVYYPINRVMEFDGNSGVSDSMLAWYAVGGTTGSTNQLNLSNPNFRVYFQDV